MFKVKQIGISDYQYYLSCKAKRMFRLTFLEKKLVFQSQIIDLYSYSIFKK